MAPGLFQVLGSHTYASYNWYTMTVTVSQGWGGQVADAKGEGENGGKPIIFFVRDNKRITTKLYVAKWENSFVRLANGTIQVRPDPISPDPARFGVEVIDEAANKNPNVKDTITVKVSTSLHGLAKNIVLEETENNSGIFTSYEGGNGSGWLMLVSVAKDAEYKNTFLVDLGDTIRATYDGQKATATVPVVKVVRLHINIMNNKQGGSPVTSITKVQGYVQWANRIYAQVGIRFDASIQIVEPPIDLSEGLDSYLGGFFRKGKIPMTDEEKSLLGVATLRTNSVNDIVVYYVNKLNLSNGNVGTQGEAFWAAAVPESKYADSVVIASNFSAYTVLAHEIGHVLLDDGNHPNGYAGTNIVNLMSGPTLIANGYTDSRRITAEQGKDMFNKRPNLLSNP